MDNADFSLPNWLSKNNPKGFNFNQRRDGSLYDSQIEDLWRWIVDFPADKSNAENPALIRKRMLRVERIKNLRDPNRWTNPNLEDIVHFEYLKAPHNTFTLGHGVYEFRFNVSECGNQTLHVYNDDVLAVDILPQSRSIDEAAGNIQEGRRVIVDKGQSVILLNDDGRLCVIRIIDVLNTGNPNSTFVDFSYKIVCE